MREMSVMAKFKTNLKALMLRKSVDVGEPITQKEIAEATGLSLPTVARWYHSDIDRIEPNTVAALTKYLGCSLGELVEVVD